MPAAAAPAGFWRRGLALLLDYGVVLAARACFGLSARLLWGGAAESSRVLGVSMTAFPWLFGFAYAVLLHWLGGQTVGKMALSVRVVTVDGGALPLSTAIGRQLGFLLSWLPAGLGLLVAAMRRDRRALHDLLAGTRVVRTAARDRAGAGPEGARML